MGDDTTPLANPHSNIGVQDLISLQNLHHCGFLRKRGRLERIAERVKILNPIVPPVAKWRQKFVLVSRGCIYIYADEFATRPVQSSSLAGFVRVVRYNVSDSRERWSFEVEPEDKTSQKTFIFGCATEVERKKWMKAIREQITIASGVHEPQSPSVAGKDDYVYLEKYVKEPKQPQKEKPETNSSSVVKKKSPLPAAPGEVEEEESDSDDNSDYDEIPDEEDLPQPKGKPLVSPRSAEANNTKQVKGRPAKASKPVLVKQISRQDFEFNGTDRKQVEQILGVKPIGTFLVRKSRSDNREVLSVNTEEGIKEYKIYNDPEEGFSIDNTIYFKNVEKLVEHYMKNSLPNRTMTLQRGFSMQCEKM